MTIDAHQHFWKYDAQKHDWIDDDMSVIRRNFLPSDLKQVYDENEIDGCVAVQADQTLAETDFLLDIAKENDIIKGVVGWADLRAPGIEEILDKYSARSKLKGWRHVVQDEPDANFLLRPEFERGISLLDKYGYTYDFLVFPHQLGSVLEFVKKFPNQKFVIDHMAKPYIKDGFFDGWAILMKAIAKHENVYCKISGLVTEADYNYWTPEQLQPYIHHVLEVFGSKRLMFGSDWPVCLVASTYSAVKEVVTDFISAFNPIDQKRVLGENAISFYKL